MWDLKIPLSSVDRLQGALSLLILCVELLGGAPSTKECGFFWEENVPGFYEILKGVCLCPFS